VVARGQLWWAELSNPIGSEPGFTRPVLIIQAESFNRSKLATVVVMAINSNLRLVDAPGNVMLPKDKSGLPKDSVANVSQLSTVDRHTLKEPIASLDRITMQQIDEGLTLVLGL
jgi:mRNA interferase MazF